jgi:hypothetical protein
MATDEWFRNTTWNIHIEAEFEGRLKRSRGAFHKAQYLRIQQVIFSRVWTKAFNLLDFV